MTATIIMITCAMQFITHMMTSISICIIILFILTSCNFALWSDIFAWNIFSNGCAAYSYIRSQSTNYFVSSGLLLPLPYDFDMAFDRGWHFIQGWLFIKLMMEHWFGNCSNDLMFYILSRKKPSIQWIVSWMCFILINHCLFIAYSIW